MPRFFYFGALLVLVAVLSAPICAQTPAVSSARVQHIVVRGPGAAMEVEIQTSGAPVEPDTQAITGPDRIVVDFPGALPDAELHALKLDRGALTGIRAGLFFNNPPITRVVLDLAEPQSYRISTSPNAIVVKLGPVDPVTAGGATGPGVHRATLQNAPLADARVAAPRVSAAVSNTPLPSALREPPPPPKPTLPLTLESGISRLHAEKVTLAQVLFEAQRQTRAELASPAGAEHENALVIVARAPALCALVTVLTR